MSTDTLERVEPQTQTGHEPPRFAHIVKKNLLGDAYVLGLPVEALCGYVWVPSRDPKNYPLCSICKEIADREWPEGPPQE